MKQLRTCTLILVLIMLMTCMTGALYAASAASVDDGEAVGEVAVPDDGSPESDGVGTPDAAPAASPSAGAKDVLYIVMVDCGTTLYGKNTFKNSIVSEAGDPQGTLLSLIECAPAMLCPNDSIAIVGYNDALISATAAVVPMSDTASISQQVEALRGIKEGSRLTSDLAGGLNALATDFIQAGALAEKYDCRLILITGGAINFNSPGSENASAEAVTGALDTLRGMGVSIHAFGFNLENSPSLKSSLSDAQKALLITSAWFKPAEYTAIPVGQSRGLASARSEYAIAVIDYFAIKGGFSASTMVAAEMQPEAEDVCFIWHPSQNRYEAATGAQYFGLLTQQAVAEDDIVRFCQASKAESGPSLDAVRAVLDSNRDSTLDGSPLMAGETITIPCPALNPTDYAVTSSDASVLEARVDDQALVLTPKVAGAGVQLTVSLTADPTQFFNVIADVKDYRLTWGIQEGETITIDGKSRTIVSAAGTGLTFGLEKQGEDGEFAALALEDGQYIACQNDGTTLTGTVIEPGTYRVSAWINENGVPMNREERSFTATVKLDEIAPVTLVTPYFREQPGQRLAITVEGNVAPISDYTVAVEPAEVADAYVDAAQSVVYIVPKAAGSAEVVISDGSGSARLTVSLTVESLMKQPLFWVFAAAVPVCLIGLTAMIVILLSKLKRR